MTNNITPIKKGKMKNKVKNNSSNNVEKAIAFAEKAMLKQEALEEFGRAERNLSKLDLFVQHQQALQFIRETEAQVKELPGYREWELAREAFNFAVEEEAIAYSEYKQELQEEN